MFKRRFFHYCEYKQFKHYCPQSRVGGAKSPSPSSPITGNYAYALRAVPSAVAELLVAIASLPDEHVDGGDAHVAVDRLPGLGEPVQLSVGQRTALVDPQTALQVAPPDLLQ